MNTQTTFEDTQSPFRFDRSALMHEIEQRGARRGMPARGRSEMPGKKLPTITMVTGETIQFRPFKLSGKWIEKITITDNGQSPEGVYACVNPATAMMSGVSFEQSFESPMMPMGDMHVAVLRQNSNHLPFNGKGVVVPVWRNQSGGYSCDIRKFLWDDAHRQVIEGEDVP